MADEHAVVPIGWLELAEKGGSIPAPYQQEIFLMECHVAGTSHVCGIEAKTECISEGDTLVLRREPGNGYDPLAIAVYTVSEERIGWVPRRKNAIPARLMDAGKMLYAKVVSREPVDDGGWLDMRVKVFMREA